jgi:hypothetical protein
MRLAEGCSDPAALQPPRVILRRYLPRCEPQTHRGHRPRVHCESARCWAHKLRIGCRGRGDDQQTAVPLHLCHRGFRGCRQGACRYTMVAAISPWKSQDMAHAFFDISGEPKVSAETCAWRGNRSRARRLCIDPRTTLSLKFPAHRILVKNTVLIAQRACIFKSDFVLIFSLDTWCYGGITAAVEGSTERHPPHA